MSIKRERVYINATYMIIMKTQLYVLYLLIVTFLSKIQYIRYKIPRLQAKKQQNPPEKVKSTYRLFFCFFQKNTQDIVIFFGFVLTTTPYFGIMYKRRTVNVIVL